MGGLFLFSNIAIKRARHIIYNNLLSLFIYIIGLSHGLYKQPISSFYSNRVLIITIEIRAQIWAFFVLSNVSSGLEIPDTFCKICPDWFCNNTYCFALKGPFNTFFNQFNTNFTMNLY